MVTCRLNGNVLMFGQGLLSVSASPQTNRMQLVDGSFHLIFDLPSFIGTTVISKFDYSATLPPYIVISHNIN